MLTRADTRPRRTNAGRPAAKSAPGFLQWLRGRRCVLAGRYECEGKLQAAHVDHGGDKGMATKASDRFAIPLCKGHHHEQHARGWATFERVYQLNAVALAADFWRAWPGRAAWERNHEQGERA